MFLIAEFNGFLKTLVIVLLVYFVLRFSLKLAWPLIVHYVAKKAGQKMENAFKGFQQQNQSSANFQEKVPNKSKEVVGEYIDFEELE